MHPGLGQGEMAHKTRGGSRSEELGYHQKHVSWSRGGPV